MKKAVSLVSRSVVLLACVALVLWPAANAAWWRLPTAASPLVGLASAIALRAVGAAALLAVPVLVMVVLRRRWFCRYACPTGLLADGAGKICPWRKQSRRVRLPALGHWALIATLVGACLGYPLLAWMDPLALLTALVANLRTTPLGWAAMVAAAGLPLVLLLSFLLPGAWCMRICPLGSLQDLLHAGRKAADAPGAEKRWAVGRRAVMASAVGLAGGLLAARSARAAPPALRPPGAAPEDQYGGLCVRCGSCARACPAGIISPDLGAHGVALFLTPVVRFDPDYCREDCRRCGQACPSGAIARVEAPAPKPSMGIARVDFELCLLTDDRECSACRTHCPYEAIQYVFSEKEYVLTVVIDADRCPGCGACQVACPVSPEKAITVVPLEKARSQRPAQAGQPE